MINFKKISLALKENNKKVIVLSIIIVSIIAVLICFLKKDGVIGGAVLQIQSPPKISCSNTKDFTVDVTLKGMPNDTLFPAASLSAGFDKSKLEFVGVEEGNILIASQNKDASGNNMELPQWSVNPTHCNETGQINVMYLDSTGGSRAFSSKGYKADKQNVLMRLHFKIRGSAVSGDIYTLGISDAVLAASDAKKSLATNNHTLSAIDCKIQIGD